MAVGRFRAMIGALVWCPSTETYLLLKRTAERGGNWECVTGRLEQGESFGDALQREVVEEIGVAVQTDFIIGTTHFFRGAPTVENEMVGVHFACSLADPSAIRLSPEHTEYRWLSAAEIEAFLPTDRVWLCNLVKRAEQLRAFLPDAIIAYNRTHGCEL